MSSPYPNEASGFESQDTYEIVYEELRQLARRHILSESAYSTLQGTALVHEAWIRLGADSQPQWANRRHLFSVVSKTMRRILIERARKRNRPKNGGSLQRATEADIENVPANPEVNDQMLEISDALKKLEATHPKKAELVRLRYFFGLSFEETADTMSISIATAKRWWSFSRSWLHSEISNS